MAVITSRTLRSVAPSAASMPSARSRRWAITVKPATDTSPMNTSPRTATASTIVAGLMMPVWPDWPASETFASAGRPANTAAAGPQ